MKQSRSASLHFPQEVELKNLPVSDSRLHPNQLWFEVFSKIEIAYPQDFLNPIHSADYVNGSRHF